MDPKDSKEQEYMEENKETMQRPPVQKEGLEEPKTKGYRPVQLGFVVFIILVLIIIIIGINSGMWGLFS